MTAIGGRMLGVTLTEKAAMASRTTQYPVDAHGQASVLRGGSKVSTGAVAGTGGNSLAR